MKYTAPTITSITLQQQNKGILLVKFQSLLPPKLLYESVSFSLWHHNNCSGVESLKSDLLCSKKSKQNSTLQEMLLFVCVIILLLTNMCVRKQSFSVPVNDNLFQKLQCKTLGVLSLYKQATIAFSWDGKDKAVIKIEITQRGWKL